MRTIFPFLFLLLTACTAITPIPAAIPTTTTFPTPTPTVEPSATPDPTPRIFEELKHKGIGVNPENGNGAKNWKFLFNGEDLPGATYDAKGLHIQIGEYGQVFVPANEILDRVKVVDGAVVVNDNLGVPHVAFSPLLGSERWIGKWVLRTEVIRDDPWKPENWIHVGSDGEASDLFDLTLLLSTPFPDNAYFGPLDKIVVGYDDMKRYVTDYPSDFSPKNPWGIRGDLSTIPFMKANFAILDPNPGEKRNYPAALGFAKYRNVDKSESLIVFGLSGSTVEEAASALEGDLGGGDGSFVGNFSLPSFDISVEVNHFNRVRIDNYRRLGLIRGGNLDPGVREFVEDWFKNGIMPKVIVTKDGRVVKVKGVVFQPLAFRIDHR